MKTSKSIKAKILTAILVIVFVVSFSMTAFADGGFYYGTFSQGFTAAQTFNKIKDYNLQDLNTKASRSYNSHLMINGSDIKSLTLNSGGSNYFYTTQQGKAGLRFSAVSGNVPTKIKGEFYIWGNGTTKRITDWSNHWGSWDF